MAPTSSHVAVGWDRRNAKEDDGKNGSIPGPYCMQQKHRNIHVLAKMNAGWRDKADVWKEGSITQNRPWVEIFCHSELTVYTATTAFEILR